ncbi:MAG: hypothetical protein ACTH0V_00075 [Microbacteriaceae bacterium]
MSTINPAARAAQEAARHDDGRFGEQQHNEPVGDLPKPGTDEREALLEQLQTTEVNGDAAHGEFIQAYDAWKEAQTAMQEAQQRLMAARAAQHLPAQVVAVEFTVREEYDDGSYWVFDADSATDVDGNRVDSAEFAEQFDIDSIELENDLNSAGGYDLAEEYRGEERVRLIVRGDGAGTLASVEEEA